MVIYYHTANNIIAVANGYCTQVMDRYGEKITLPTLVGYRLLGGVTTLFEEASDTEIVHGQRLKFDLNGVTILTETVMTIEDAPSLSIRPHPQPHSLSPAVRASLAPFIPPRG